MFQVNQDYLWVHEQRQCELIKQARQASLARELRREKKKGNRTAILVRIVSVFL